ncbi:hypothetical protein IW146_005084 [Coemansia sp. RSA 922]|nr:hypothetical protein H4S03_006166 [Coemansia sp. S3946]KAJ2048347.1 hypothetical protein H4S04_003886 [Coemansia sp. S16]KAJ2111807.1 hypothetical protein IW146_005084 [Coemansia sp. RSA 922]
MKISIALLVSGLVTVAAAPSEPGIVGANPIRLGRPAAVSRRQDNGLHTRAANQCNGYAELCNRTFDKVAFPTTHNSYAYGDNLAANQNVDIQTQLNAGIRGFMLDLHPNNGATVATSDPYLCHASCVLLSDGPLVNELKRFKSFLDGNANEVITIFIENDGPFTAAQMSKAFTTAGLDSYVYQPKSTTAAWPTLKSMISQNKRLVVFTDAGADASVPWILYDKDYVVQTPFSVAVGTTFGCTPLTTVRPLWVMNHFVYKNFSFGGSNVEVPALDSAATVNTRQSIVAQANVCGGTGVFPNFVTVDFYDVGGLFQAVADINNVTYNAKPPPAASQPDTPKTPSAAATGPRAVLAAIAASLLLVASL